MPIKISLVEDIQGVRERLAALLNDVPGMRCVGAHATGEDAVRNIPAEQPDVALVDVHLPGMTGIECVSKLKAQLPKLQILMLTRFEQSDLIFNSIRAGASGYLLKQTPRQMLLDALQDVHTGGSPMSSSIARKVVQSFRHATTPGVAESRSRINVT